MQQGYIKSFLSAGLGVLLFNVSPSVPSLAQEYQAEAIQGLPSADDVPEAFRNLLSEQGVRVQRGSRTVCEFWLCKELQLQEGFEETDERLYPLTPGQLVGVFTYGRRGSDFRDQMIRGGWFSMRFALQPIDGNHIGTSPTRDFLLLVDVDEDEVGKEWSETDLNNASSQAAGTTHPAMICLQRRSSDAEPLSMRHNEENDWWIVHVVTKGKQGEKTVDLPIDMIVAGHALE